MRADGDREAPGVGGRKGSVARPLGTANVADFEKIARARDLHAGIVFIEDGDLLPDEQDAIIRRAVAAIEGEYQQGRDTVNRVMFIGRGKAARFDEMP